MTLWTRTFAAVLTALLACAGSAVADAGAAPAKPKVAVFPIAGGSDAALRDRLAMSLRLKLDRQGAYEPLDGFAMSDIASAAKSPVDSSTAPAVVKDLASDSGAVVLVWGDASRGGGGDVVRLKVLDLRDKDAAPRDYTTTITDGVEVRFAVEKVLESLPGVGAFGHPNEESVRHDLAADAAFAKNPNLVPNGDFAQPGRWNAIYQSEYYPVDVRDTLPETDKVCIYRVPARGGEKAHNVLAMKLSKDCAENNGMACLSDPIEIDQGVKFRLHFRYKSDGPTLHVFVKGYTTGKNLAGEKADREIYRRQVPPSGGTNGRWVTVEDDLNPQHVHFPVKKLRIDLYAYLSAGTVQFDDVQLKAIGKQGADDVARDDAIKAPTTGQLEEGK